MTNTPNTCELIERPPSVEEYLALCESVGWIPYVPVEAIETALRNSLHHVVAVHDDKVVGMGRVVSDGAIFFYVQDIAVAPDYRGQQIGTRIVGEMVSWVRTNAPRPAHLYLFAATGKEAIYEQFGFESIPNGMYLGLTAEDADVSAISGEETKQ